MRLFLQIINAVYGKTIENVWDRETVKICRSKEELLQSVSKKTYKRQVIVNEDMVIVAHKKLVVYYNKPFYIGFSVLNISKYIMYDYYYNVLRKYFIEYRKVQLLYSDTDSFILKIKSSDIHQDLENLSPTFDFSNLPPKHKLFDSSKKSKLFHFKEEFGMLPILRYVSLGSKVYALQTVCCHEFNPHLPCRCRLSKPNNNNNFLKQREFPHSDKLTLKGVSKMAKSQFTFEDYLYCLQNQRAQRTDDFRITSKCQQISSNIIRKIALSGFMDKRYVLDCGIHTVPFSLDNNSRCYEPGCN